MHIKIGTMIASLRVKHGIQQKDFALMIKQSVSYLSQIENNNRKPSHKLLIEIVKNLEITLERFIILLIRDSYPKN